MKRILLSCGHVCSVENIIDTESNFPVCPICHGIKPVVIKATVEGTDGLEGRIAECNGHKGGSVKLAASSWDLPFFEYCPNKKYDKYYCGCWGWN